MPADAQPLPFAAMPVTLPKQEHIQWVMDASYWHTQFNRRVARQAQHERHYRRLFDRLKALSAQREAASITELALAQAKIGDLQQRVFGRKSERSKGACERQGSTELKPARRGQRPDATGHGRTILAHLPQRVETVEIRAPQCPQCGLELSAFPDTEDSEVLEIEVQRDLLQGRQLDPCRPDHRARQEQPSAPSDHPDQGHLAVALAQGLRSRPVRIVGPQRQRVGFGFTECLLTRFRPN